MANTSIHAASGQEPIRSDSAPIIHTALVIMGFRVYWYGPCTTSVFGGDHGAGVPLPTLKNRWTVHTATVRPHAAMKMPA